MEGNFDQHFIPVLDEPEDDESVDQRVTSEQSKCPFREQDIYLPIANVARIMKNAVPQSGKIAKDAKECVQECVSEFISFITSEASERCAQEKRKTINGEDVLFAMATLGFDPYIEPLKIYLQKYRDLCVHGTIKPYAEAQAAQVEQFKKASTEIQQTLKEEKVATFTEAQRSDVTNNVDLVSPFTPTHFSEMLVTSDDTGNVFSTQEASIDSQIQFP